LLPQSMHRLFPFSAMMASSTFFAAGVHELIAVNPFGRLSVVSTHHEPGPRTP
jgi:hypothetical protein